MEHTDVRILIANVERGLKAREAAAANEPETFADLRADWGALVKFLALPSAPEMRACSHCGGEVRRDATICKYCWHH
jgi:hypothetical protein